MLQILKTATFSGKQSKTKTVLWGFQLQETYYSISIDITLQQGSADKEPKCK